MTFQALEVVLYAHLRLYKTAHSLPMLVPWLSTFPDPFVCVFLIILEFVDPRINGPMACARDIYQSTGMRGFFVGSVSCMWRDVPSFGLYFLAYEYTKRRIRDWEQSNSKNPQSASDGLETSGGIPEPSVTAMLVAGAVAGVCGWGSTYPFDCIKSVTQTLPNDTPASQRRMWVVAKSMYDRGGAQAFTRGFGATIFRSVPVNAVTFVVYESMLSFFQKNR